MGVLKILAILNHHFHHYAKMGVDSLEELKIEDTAVSVLKKSSKKKKLKNQAIMKNQKLQRLLLNLHWRRNPTVYMKKNRCFVCKKKLGLTGFSCRCGQLFCGIHRYTDKHECTFDYKAMGEKEISEANPVIVAQKLNKI